MNIKEKSDSKELVPGSILLFFSTAKLVFSAVSIRGKKRKNHPKAIYSKLFSVFIILILLFAIFPPTVVNALAPIVEATDNPRLYETSTIIVDPTITVNDNGNTFTSASVSITGNYISGQDSLIYSKPSDLNITGYFDSSTGILTLTGNGNGTDYQRAFRSVSYRNSSPSDSNELPRTILFVLGGNTLYSSETGHFYEWVTASSLNWFTAVSRAENMDNYGSGSGYPVGLYGMQGYMVTVTSAAENNFVTSKLGGQGWMGASDNDVNKVWRWKTGPEGLMDDGLGMLFFRQAGWTSDDGPNGTGTGAAATQPEGTYYNWASGEPNDWPDGSADGENMAHFYETGLWNDYSSNNTSVAGYVVEYGGMAGDPTLQLMDSVVITFASNTNNAPVFTETSPVSVDMNMNGSPTDFALTLHASDGDGDTITWSISTPALHGTATASGTGTSMVIGYVPTTNYTGSDSFKVRISDASGGFAVLQVNVTITEFNVAPTAINLSSTNVSENQSSGTTVGTFTTTDANITESFTYTLVSGDGSGDNSSFTIDGNSLKTTAIFNYEIDNSYSVRVRSTDHGGLYTEETFTISVTNVNETPTDILLSNASIAENQPANTTVGTLSTSDPDTSNTFTYTLVGGTGSDDNSSFNISGTSLRTSAIFNYESDNSYTVRIRSTDQGGLYYEEAFTISITDQSESPVITSNGGGDTASISIQENTTAVTTVTASDDDTGTTLAYSIVGGADASLFSINSSTGVLTFTNAPDYETKQDADSNNVYVVQVQASDGSLADTQTISVTITNENETPTDISLSGTSIEENQPVNTVVGTLSTTDQDSSSSFTYTLVSGDGSDDNASFNISGSSLRTSAIFNYETDNSYSVRIRTTDQGGLYYEESFTITITDVNDAPVITSNEGGDTAAITISENTTAVTTVTATDADSGATLMYSISGGADGSLFSIGSGTGVLTFTNAPDYETKQDADANNVYVVQVQASDGSLADTQTISVSITNENETPTDISLSETSVEENQPVDTVVGTLSTTDQDASNTFTYTLVVGDGSDDNASFHIDGSNLLTSAIFDKEVKDSYSVRIRTTDQDGLYYEEAFTITITNVNEAPTDITLDNSTIDENEEAGTVVGGLTTSDVDASSTFTYTLVTGGAECPGTDNALFQIDEDNLTTKQIFDYEEDDGSYEVCIRSTDQGDLSTEKAFTITLEDVNDGPEVKTLIPDQSAKQDTIFSFTFAEDTFYDQDGDALTYSATLEDGSTLPGWLIFTGNMRLFTGTPLEGDTGNFSIKVTADDGQGGTISDVFMLSVSAAGNIDPVQNYPLLDQSVIVGTEYIYTIDADTFVDPDSTEPLSYLATLADGSDLPDWLTFNPLTRTFAGTVPADLTGSINIKVNVYDVDGGTISDIFTLNFVTSIENQAPYVQHSLIDKNAVQDTAFLYTFAADTFKDPDDDVLTYEASLESGDALPLWLSFTGETRTFSGTPGVEDVQTFLVKVTASDGNDHSVSSVFRIAVSEAGKEILYKVVNPSGNTITDEDVQVIIPPNLVSAGTHPFLYVTSDIDVPGAPSGYKSLNRYREITLFLEENQLIENFSSPVQVCFVLTPSQISSFLEGNIRIATRGVEETSWTLLKTSLDESKKMACASVSHFSYFGLFTKIIPKTIPETGFAPGIVTELPQQTALNTYQDLGSLWMEIPSLGIKESIVGVYPAVDGWDISWLGDQIGWLNTTAYPTWAGNSVLTGHVVDNNGQPGIFYYLHQMGYGDQVIIHLGDLKYVYEVRTVNLYTDPQASSPFQHEELPWITLITCRQYDEEAGEYQWRTVVRAVQVEIQN